MFPLLEKIGESISITLIVLVAVFSFFWDGLSMITSTSDVYSDVFVYNQSDGSRSIKFGNNSGDFLPKNSSWSSGWEVKAAKLDGDALSDFLLYNKTNGQWFKSVYDGSGEFAYINGTWSPDWETYVLDLNGDSLSDVFLYSKSVGYWFKCLNVSGQNGFNCGQRGQWDSGWQIYPVRLNSDLLDDLFLYNLNSGVWFRAVNEIGDNFNLTSGNWSPAWQIYPGDFTGDGLSDLMLYGSSNSPRAILARNTGSDFDYPFTENWDPDWTSINPADFNDDGKADVFLYKYSSGTWVKAISNGTGFSYSNGQLDPGLRVYISDVNNDSKHDVLVYNPLSGIVIPLVNTGAGSFNQKTIDNWGVNRLIVVTQNNLQKAAGFSSVNLGSFPPPPAFSAKFGIFYSLWHCPFSEGSGAVYDISEAIAGTQSWGPIPSFHWWEKPQAGYYCLTNNSNLLTQHAIALKDAGIDFIYVDATNHAYTSPTKSDRPQSMIIDPFNKLLEVWAAIPNAPKVVVWVPAPIDGDMVDYLLDRLDLYPNLKFHYLEKPLLLVTTNGSDEGRLAVLKGNYTVRKMWGLTGQSQFWSGLEACSSGFKLSGGSQTCDQKFALFSDLPEQVSIAMAYQETYMSDKRTAVPRFGGETFIKQFETLFNNPNTAISTVSGWNGWIAQRFCLDSSGVAQANPDNCVTDELPDGSKVFVDLYDIEYGGDIEPGQNETGDYYYRLMKECISRYRQGQKCGTSSVPH